MMNTPEGWPLGYELDKRQLATDDGAIYDYVTWKHKHYKTPVEDGWEEIRDVIKGAHIHYRTTREYRLEQEVRKYQERLTELTADQPEDESDRPTAMNGCPGCYDDTDNARTRMKESDD